MSLLRPAGANHVGSQAPVARLRPPTQIAHGYVCNAEILLQGGEVCGHVALSRLKSPAGGLALAPLAVVPARQQQGIGAALVRRAFEQARALGYAMIFVLGHPAYYPRFGFSVEEAVRFPCPYAGPHFMALSLQKRAVPATPVTYPDAFAKLP